MKKYIGFIFVMMLLVAQFGCKKETIKNEGEKLILSSQVIIPGDVYCDDEYCYWIDPDLFDEPVEPSAPIKGEADRKGMLREFYPAGGGKHIEIYCWGEGEKCGSLYVELPNGDLYEVGLYLVVQ